MSLRLARDSFFNLLGQGLPAVIAYFAIPPLTRQLGADQFGILTLAWVVLGYFSLFDLGLGRALTQVVADRLAAGHHAEIPGAVWASVALMFGFGTLGAIAAAVATPTLVHHVLTIRPALQPETEHCFWILAASIPIVILTDAFRGLLEAGRRFDLVNLIRAPANSSLVLAPVATLPFSHDLVVILAVLVAVRIVILVAHVVLALRVFPDVAVGRSFALAHARPLLKLGSWMTVTNVVGPIMVSMDRFVVGSVLSMSAVAYYTAPYEAVTKMWLLPAAVTGVLFPEFAALIRHRSPRAGMLYRTAIAAVIVLLFPLTAAVVAFAHEGLAFWLGPIYAAQSTVVLRWLAAGVLINSVATVPFTLVQGAGRPDLTAKLHLAELGPYLLILWLCILRFGIVGAAVAWTARVAADCAVLLTMGQRIVPEPRRVIGASLLTAAAIAAALVAAAAPVSIATRVLIVAIGSAAIVALALGVILGHPERHALRASMLRWLRRPSPVAPA